MDQTFLTYIKQCSWNKSGFKATNSLATCISEVSLSLREVGCNKTLDPKCPKFKGSFKPNVYFTANPCHLIRSNQKLGIKCPAPPLTEHKTDDFFLQDMLMQHRGCDFNYTVLKVMKNLSTPEDMFIWPHIQTIASTLSSPLAWKSRNIKCNNHVTVWN